MGEALPKEPGLQLALKTFSEGTRQISDGSLFQSRGATAEKARFLVLSGPPSALGPSAVFPGYIELFE